MKETFGVLEMLYILMVVLQNFMHLSKSTKQYFRAMWDLTITTIQTPSSVTRLEGRLAQEDIRVPEGRHHPTDLGI